ncbi:MAG: hypothetical protein ACJ72E_06800 [Marmoricola sp.]
MHLNPSSAMARAQAAICVLAVTLGLTVAPSLLSSAGAAAPQRAAVSDCASAKAALAQAQHRRAAARAKVAKDKKVLAKAKHAHKHAKVRKAKKALTRAKKQYAAADRVVKTRQAQRSSACASSPAPSPGGTDAGQKLSLLGLGQGLSLGPIDASQLTALLDQLLPGVVDQLDVGQLTSLLSGFNGAGDLDPTQVLALLGGGFSPTDVTSLLSGAASPELLSALAGSLLDQLSGLAGGFPVPPGFDPTGLFETFAGMFGGLDPSQLGSLLAMLTSAFGADGSPLDASQLTDLLDALVPGVSGDFDPTQLTSMLGALNGGGLSAATLSNLLGGQFSPAQLQQVLGGTAGPQLLADVIAQVMAQLATAGGGGLQLPGALDASTVTDLIATVTSLLGSITGGGGIIPVVCGLVPIPLLCP